MADFKFNKKDDISVAEISGRFTIEDKDMFQSVIKDKIDMSDRGTCIDATNLKYIDSSGIGDLLKLKMEAAKNNHSIYVIGLNESIFKVFKMARLDSVFAIMTPKEFQEKFNQ